MAVEGISEAMARQIYDHFHEKALSVALVQDDAACTVDRAWRASDY